MVIIDNNLKSLMKQYELCDESLIDDFSLKVKLGNHYFATKKNNESIVYGSHPKPSEIFEEKTSIKQNLTLAPGEQVITCSQHIYKIPEDYFGLVQTKGTLARLFVAATCNDGQIEPGFKGYITLELINHSPWTIEIPKGSEIAQLYMLKCSMKAEKKYSGRYAGLAMEGATIPVFPES